MTPHPRPFRSFRAGVSLVAAFAVLLLAAGCQNVFVPKYRVFVDAIARPDAPAPAGQSYRLVAKRSMVSNMPVQIPVLKACVDAALQSRGLYEPPANVPPDLVIEVTYGRDTAPRALAAMRETYLQLSARGNQEKTIDKGTGPEWWDVRVAVLGVSGSIETAFPLLCSVAAEHMATNTGFELKIEVPQNSPAVAAVRTAALRTLDAQAQQVAAAQTAGAPGGAVAPRPAATVLGSGIQVEAPPESPPGVTRPRAVDDVGKPPPSPKTADSAGAPAPGETPR